MKKKYDPSALATLGDLEAQEQRILKGTAEIITDVVQNFEGRMGGMEERQDAMAVKIIQIEETMATKADIARLESKMVTKSDIADLVGEIQSMRQELMTHIEQQDRSARRIENHEHRITSLEFAVAASV